MKTAEELFETHRPKGALSVNRPMYFSNFVKALTEDRQQIVDKIKEISRTGILITRRMEMGSTLLEATDDTKWVNLTELLKDLE